MHGDVWTFTVGRVASRSELLDACAVRAAAYGRHVPALREVLATPDAADFDPATTVLVARDVARQRVIGTVRVQAVDRHAPAALPIEESAELPAWLTGAARGEVTRLAVAADASPLVRMALLKAMHLHALQRSIDWLVVGARSELLVRLYHGLGFRDLLDARWVPLAHTAGLAHRVLAFDVPGAEPAWRAQAHPLYRFMAETEHDGLLGFGRTCVPRAPSAPDAPAGLAEPSAWFGRGWGVQPVAG